MAAGVRSWCNADDGLWNDRWRWPVNWTMPCERVGGWSTWPDAGNGATFRKDVSHFSPSPIHTPPPPSTTTATTPTGDFCWFMLWNKWTSCQSNCHTDAMGPKMATLDAGNQLTHRLNSRVSWWILMMEENEEEEQLINELMNSAHHELRTERCHQSSCQFLLLSPPPPHRKMSRPGLTHQWECWPVN